MKFEEQLQRIKQQSDLYSKFLIGINAIVEKTILIPITLETNHTIERKYDNTTADAIYFYEDDKLHIYSVKVLQHGMYTDEYIASIQTIEEALDNEQSYLENEFNNAKVELIDYDFNNQEKHLKFSFNFLGDINDAFATDDWGYYVYLELLEENSFEFWSFLLIQSEELKEEKRYDLAFLLIFSALENYINLKIEIIQCNYYKELNLEGMDLKLKYSFLLKHELGVSTGNKEEHPCKDLIMKKFSELYKFRNSIAHGRERNITKLQCEECFDTFIFTYTAVTNKPKNNQELLKYIKDY